MSARCIWCTKSGHVGLDCPEREDHLAKMMRPPTPEPKPTIAATIRIRAYDVISRAVEEGVQIGWRRAHKYVDEPSEATILEALESAVMGELCDVVDFDSDDTRARLPEK